ncbi:MAG: ribose 5-phosphate isomerase B [Nitrospinaceae bacterium]|nr:ribose 5-phosphate isomerase B [Nitrospinaceae bacterium]NIR55015.1 ribose 5-phosphate isomerase B [Nitrospinaceae bacterium]NIS85414.1 ribose 5-phosphate isomerase B [Nitrospinaceae bacterium]NIT82253.1 ribose 5-phosphate isomerase B [Nitrospinaceae bacterium]NIU44483.1 ribose 5-phosphate isomerase B [Nitrospinaceae bacterium]
MATHRDPSETNNPAFPWKQQEKIAIASDHAGYDLKESIIAFLLHSGWQVEDLGPENSDSVDYPDYGIKLAKWVAETKVDRGIVICGTGIGMSIVVNRFPGIRGTLCNDTYTAKLCREHNDSNILILGGRVVGKGLAQEIVRTWLETPFQGGRHQRRLDKINKIDHLIKIKGDI